MSMKKKVTKSQIERLEQLRSEYKMESVIAGIDSNYYLYLLYQGKVDGIETAMEVLRINIERI